MIKDFKKPENINNNDVEKTQASETISQDSSDSEIAQAVSLTIYEIISNNHSKNINKDKLKQQNIQIFTSKSIPSISIGDYITRIVKYTKLEESTLILALIYIDRICKAKKVFLTEYNIHRILLASTLVAIKFNEDKYYANTYYAKIGGVQLDQINKLEEEFLNLISFNLHVESKMFEKYERNLVNFSDSK